MTEVTRRGQREDIRVTEKKQWYSDGRKLKMKVKEIYEASKAGSDAAGRREFIALLFPLVSYSTLLSPRSSPLLLFIAVSTSNRTADFGKFVTELEYLVYLQVDDWMSWTVYICAFRMISRAKLLINQSAGCGSVLMINLYKPCIIT